MHENPIDFAILSKDYFFAIMSAFSPFHRNTRFDVSIMFSILPSCLAQLAKHYANKCFENFKLKRVDTGVYPVCGEIFYQYQILITFDFVENFVILYQKNVPLCVFIASSQK